MLQKISFEEDKGKGKGKPGLSQCQAFFRDTGLASPVVLCTLCSSHVHTSTPHAFTEGRSTRRVGFLPATYHRVLTTWISSSRRCCKVAHLNSLQGVHEKQEQTRTVRVKEIKSQQLSAAGSWVTSVAGASGSRES